MTDREQEFKDALIKFCEDWGFEIAGTCEYEGIYGEITVRDKHRPLNEHEWLGWDEYKFNFA